jgi:hypothetical protein
LPAFKYHEFIENFLTNFTNEKPYICDIHYEIMDSDPLEENSEA